MRKHKRLLWLTAFFLIQPAYANEDRLVEMVEFDLPPPFVSRCESELPPPTLHLRIIDEGHTLSREVGALLLTQAQRASLAQLGISDRSDALSFGITTFKNEINYHAGGATLSLEQGEEEVGEGVVCVSPLITIEIIINQQRIDIAKEIPRGSCTEAEVFAHELRHVALNKKNMEDMSASIEHHVARRLGDERIFYGSAGGIGSLLDGELKDEVISLFRANDALMLLRHAQIDSPAESYRFAHACHGEVQEIENRIRAANPQT